MLEEDMATAEREQLARAMEEGYRQEAESPSLDADWTTVVADGL